MKLAKSLFLGSVAGLAAVAGAQAADLPVKKAAAVEYVRVCSTYGAGFFYIPGTETCLRVGGRVRAEFQYLEPTDREDDAIGFRARGRLNIDARTATAYGLLRTFVRFEMTRDTGVYGFSSTSANVDQAFIQLGGALHQLRSDTLFGTEYPDSTLGWAVTAQGSVNLPMLAEGDALWIAATYADGALGYLGFDPDVTAGSTTRDVVDAYIGSDGDIETGRGWSIAGGMNHYWTPTVRQNVFGSYARVEYGSNVASSF